MRSLSSRPFLVGLLLVAAAIIAMPLFVTMGEGNCSIPSPNDPEAPSSWDCFQPVTWDFRIPVVIGASGIALMLATVLRTRRASRN